MTCIVGIQAQNKVLIAGDSALVAGHDINIMGQSKVFKCNNYVIGCAGSARVADLMRHKFKPSDPITSNIREHMVSHFIEELKSILHEGGAIVQGENGEFFPGVFLVGYKEHLFTVHQDFFVSPVADNFTAVGVSQDIALGSLSATEHSGHNAKERAIIALEASSRYNGAVCPPYTFLTT